MMFPPVAGDALAGFVLKIDENPSISSILCRTHKGTHKAENEEVAPFIGFPFSSLLCRL